MGNGWIHSKSQPICFFSEDEKRKIDLVFEKSVPSLICLEFAISVNGTLIISFNYAMDRCIHNPMSHLRWIYLQKWFWQVNYFCEKLYLSSQFLQDLYWAVNALLSWKKRCLSKEVLYRNLKWFNPIEDGGRGGGRQKAPLPPTSFSPVISTNAKFGPKNFLTFSVNPFDTLVQNFKFVPSASPNYWTWTKTTAQKKRFFWSNPHKIEVMITFLIEMLELPNFGHMTTCII